jgi:hypothetical protein
MAKYDKERRQNTDALTSATPKKEDGTDAEGFFTHPRGHIRDRIILHETRESYKEGQFIGLNGFPFLVQYNKEVDVPRPVIKMLRTRIVTIVEKDTETGVETVRHLPRFNFTVVKENVNQVPADVIGAFQCEICERPFDSKLAYLSHMRAHQRKKETVDANGKGNSTVPAGEAGGQG